MALQRRLKDLARAAAKFGFVVADVPYRTRPGPRILIYHQVGSELGRQMEVTIPAFEFQLEWLMGNGTVVTLEDALARRGEIGSERLFVLTFDDGYEDLHSIAFPRLQRLGLPFTVYVTTGPVESGTPSFPGGAADPVSWPQLAEMAEYGATIGAHTHTHPDLRSLTAGEIETDLARSDELLTERLGIEPEHFCYPYGFWSAASDSVVRSRYRSATLGAGSPVTTSTDPFLIHRVPVQLSDSPLFFARKMKSGLKLEERVRRMLNGYRGPV